MYIRAFIHSIVTDETSIGHKRILHSIGVKTHLHPSIIEQEFRRFSQPKTVKLGSK